MPPWGRPPGARLARRGEKGWARQSWGYDDRFEELDSEDDGLHGVELDYDYAQNRFVSDELRFDGIDMGATGTRHRRYGTHDNEDPAYAENDNRNRALARRADTQVMLRDKEDVLVERALERIARARALGKTNVKLSQAEIDALDRLERSQQQQARPSSAPKPSTLKSKKTTPAKSKATETKKSNKTPSRSINNSPKPKVIQGRERNKSSASTRSNRDEPTLPYPTLPEDDYEYAGGRLPHVSQGYYRQGLLSRPGSRSGSSHSLRQSQYVQQPHPYSTSRYVSMPATPDDVSAARRGSNSSRASRPDPSEPDWEPRARSNSSLVNIPLDQLPYQAHTGRAPRFDPSDPRFASPQRRTASGPATMASQYGRPQDELFLPDERPEVMRYLASSDDEDDDDYDQGVQVNVVERPTGDYGIQTRSSAAARSGERSSGSKAVKKRR